MATFTRLNINNIVTDIIEISDEKLLDNGIENEQKGIDFCHQLFDKDFINCSYKQCFKLGSKRYNYPSVGASYDPQNDAFINVKPYSSWLLDNNFKWIPGIPKPDNINQYVFEVTNNSTGDGIWRDVNYIEQ
jgi:hypothetical protein